MMTDFFNSLKKASDIKYQDKMNTCLLYFHNTNT